jgi:hypothetical protein
MKIGLTAFIISLLIVSTSYSQQSVTSLVKSQAMEMAKAMVKGDTRNFSKYMLPELVEAGGGANKVNLMMDSMFAVFKSFGGSVNRITYGNPGKIVSFKKELQTTLPQTTEVTSPFGDVVLSSTLVAISRDNGKNLYFYDTSLGRAEQLKNKLPNLSPDLVVPPPEKPKFTPKAQ